MQTEAKTQKVSANQNRAERIIQDLKQRIKIDEACRKSSRGGFKGDLTRKINANKTKLANLENTCD